ncbi:hypothetical protein D917_05819 [Trichinella nativa]|uniref:Uncharacterized protein n=1 Tax=Trichinella nativa TaxID=6335 RepID=A0A1Y3EZV9_9BILA|nr:hypothetical protein D917_05819 [Trichinella nativa]
MSSHDSESGFEVSAEKVSRMEKEQHKSRKRVHTDESSTPGDRGSSAKEQRLEESRSKETDDGKFISVYDIHGFEFKWPKKHLKKTNSKNRITYSYNLNVSDSRDAKK